MRAKMLKNKKIDQKLSAVSRCNTAKMLKNCKGTSNLLIYMLNFSLLAQFGEELCALQI